MQPESFPWRSLGTLLVDEGLLTEVQLDLALAEQRRSGRLLGQILVDFGYVTGLALARALAEQHGVDLGSEPGLDEVETVLKLAIAGEPTYVVCKVSSLQSYQTLSVLYESPNFLEATDFAFEYVDEHEPDALE